MKLKYETLIKEQNLSLSCPNANCISINATAYRWVLGNNFNSDSFLPKILFDQKRNVAPRKNSQDDDFICSCCALSFFNTEDQARSRFLGIPARTRKLLGYTHLAEGNIAETHGLASPVNDYGHFDFFEFEGIDLGDFFKIISDLN